jgi:hypothetical protein
MKTPEFKATVRRRITKVALKKRYIKEGRWNPFVARREALKKAGWHYQRAHDRAFEEFEADGGVPEFTEVPDPPVNGTKTSSSRTIAFDPEVSSLPRKDREKRIREPGLTATREMAEVIASPQEVISWVGRNISVDDPDVSTAPGADALSMLQWVREAPSHRDTFWTSIWTKLVPTKSQINAKAEVQHGEKGQVDVIEKLIKIKEKVEEHKCNAETKQGSKRVG